MLAGAGLCIVPAAVSLKAHAETILKPSSSRSNPATPSHPSNPSLLVPLVPLVPLVQKPSKNAPESLLKNETPPVNVKDENIVVALDWVPNTNHTGLYVANEKKWYAAQHLVPILLQPSQTTATKLVGAGKAEFGVSFTNDVARARARGIPVVAIAAIIQNNTSCFAWRKNMNIKSLRDFEGKRYGGWGSPEEELTLSYLMKKQGADFKKVKVVTTGVSDFVATTPRNADFMWIYMGWDGIRAKLEGIDLGTVCPKDLDPVFNTASPLIVTSEKLIQEKPELIKRFLAATAQGYEWAVSNPDDASAAFLKQVPELDKKLVQASAQYLAGEYKKGVPHWGVQNEKSWARYLDWAKSIELVPKIEPASHYFDNRFLPQ